MIVDNKYIKQLRKYTSKITPELESILIDRLGKEPIPFEYSEQDLAEQTRKIISRYCTPVGRLELLYGLDKLEAQMATVRLKIMNEVNMNNLDSDSF